MGWYRIDPDKGEALKEGYSKLSRPPDLVLLNAVPGVDDDEATCYLGDGPWDMASTMPAEIAAVTGDTLSLSDEELRDLLLRRVLQPSIAGSPPKIGTQLLQVADAF